MLFRNLMAMDVEECLRAYPLDATVLLSGCDKTAPAMLMGIEVPYSAFSHGGAANVVSIIVTMTAAYALVDA